MHHAATQSLLSHVWLPAWCGYLKRIIKCWLKTPCLRAAAAPPGCLPCALDIAAVSCLRSSSLSSLRLTGVPSGTRTKPPFPSGASPSGSPDGGPSPPSRLASFPMLDPSRPLYSDQCTIRVLSAYLCPKSAALTASLGDSEHLRRFIFTASFYSLSCLSIPLVSSCFSVSRISAAVQHSYQFSVRGVSVLLLLTVTQIVSDRFYKIKS